MNAALALLLAGAVFSEPGSAPCAGLGANPCLASPFVPPAALAAMAEGKGAAGVICDGAIILNHFAKDGAAFGPVRQVVALSGRWKAAHPRDWVEREGRACLLTRVFAGVHVIAFCDNPAIVEDEGAGDARLAAGESLGAWPARGGATVEAVPIPAPILMLLSGLAGLVFLRFRRRA